VFSAGRAVPRKAGDGTRPEALSGPCGMMRDGVNGDEAVRPAKGLSPPKEDLPRLKLAGGVMRDTTGRITLRAGGAAER